MECEEMEPFATYIRGGVSVQADKLRVNVRRMHMTNTKRTHRKRKNKVYLSHK